MLRKTCILALLAAGSLQAAEYRFDPHHTNARFAIDHFGASTNVGGFYGLEGSLQFDAAKRSASVEVVIPVASLRTGSDPFTAHLKSDDLFQMDNYPEIRFVGKKFKFNKQRKITSVDGELTMLGVTHPVTLKASKFHCYDNPILKTEVCGGDFHATIDRTKWGMDFLVDIGMSKDVRLDIQIEAAKVEAPKK